MSKAMIPDNKPKILTLKEGETYAWCACGRSKNQPWCDGSHQGTSFTPTVFMMKEEKEVALCMCKQTKTPPYCDGSHKDVELE
ncbi:CDGSH iron-sulfur domain-containing protein [Halosquirtibacter laminarini]|uniref:CDGSH iron-sulfur domain-containing protein n=1 Tax=Halosquirtibacter laminarini TaxID=3374600 RepID=A0AC61NQ67_9BACT|nr:CDGSH iron-sulfur domain-containing protein [Prolixibacteraceae bacterium]